MEQSITVSRPALSALLTALTGPPHFIREMQATRNLPGNFISQLVAEYQRGGVPLAGGDERAHIICLCPDCNPSKGTSMITKTHELKAWPDMYEPMARGDKPFDIRLNDRGFQKGDHVTLREWDPNAKPGFEYTGRTSSKVITYVLSGWGLQPEHVALGYKDAERTAVSFANAQGEML